MVGLCIILAALVLVLFGCGKELIRIANALEGMNRRTDEMVELNRRKDNGEG